jgi:hypothetical protein
MNVPDFLLDLIRLLLNLAPLAALGCLVLAGIHLRKEGGINFHMGGGFTRWMLWSVLFMTLPQMVGFFGSRGLHASLPSGSVSTVWLQAIENGFTYFIQDLVLARLVPTLAAFFVLRIVLDLAEGMNPLRSIIAAMFLLSVAATRSLIAGFNEGGDFALADVLEGLWNYLAGRIMPIVAGLAVIGAVLNFAASRPWLRLVVCALGFLTVSALWRLVVAMMT